jgi:cyclophilin family peptidyl-prolyl cis-trans isomerase
VEKGDGSSFTVATGGGPQKVGILEVVLDGYSAPLTAGNFADLVLKGAYDGIKLRSTEQAILSDTETLDSVGRALPIEILPSGEFQPLYRTTLNVQVRPLSISPLLVWFLLGYPFGATLIAYLTVACLLLFLLFKDGELPILPLSVYGAVAMAHNPTSEDFSAPSQFFFYLYDRRSVQS